MSAITNIGDVDASSKRISLCRGAEIAMGVSAALAISVVKIFILSSVAGKIIC